MNEHRPSEDRSSILPLSAGARWFILVSAFAGWMFAGVVMAMGPLALRAAPLSFLAEPFRQQTAEQIRQRFTTSASPAVLQDVIAQVEQELTRVEAAGGGFSSRSGETDGAIALVRSELGPDMDAPSVVALIRQRRSQLESRVGVLFSRYVCAFLLGAAVGGLLLGWLGDRLGRARAMGISILCYAVLTVATYWVQSPTQLLFLRFLACLGIGGMWPNGVALVSEAWPDVSRPTLAGLIGSSANVGFMGLALLALWHPVTPDDWRWVLRLGILPALLGIVVFLWLPESPGWLQHRRQVPAAKQARPLRDVFRPPLVKFTLLGILLGTVPLMGSWGGSNWLVPWAGQVGGDADPELKAWTQWILASGGSLGSLLGGWIAHRLGRRTTYFLVSALTLALTYSIFAFLRPGGPGFFWCAFAVGFCGTLYFGWLPLYLPELFPTPVRATGVGVSFNFGRIATAGGVLGTGLLMVAFDGRYAQVGQVTCLVYAIGMVIILFAPDTSSRSISGLPQRATGPAAESERRFPAAPPVN